MDSTSSVSEPQGPWYLRTSARTVGTIAGVGAVFLGIWGAISISVACILSGVFEIMIGLVLISLEAPFLCTFMSFLSRLGAFWEGKPQWYKAVFYGVLGIIPVCLCAQLSVILASAGVIITAVLYGFMALGKRGGGAAAPPPMTGDAGYGQMDRSGLVESGMYNQNKTSY